VSVRSRKLSWNEHGDPTLIIEAVGSHDVYRLAEHMTHGQCEFADIGFSVIRRLKRKWGKGRSNWMMRYMHGDGGYR